MATHPRWGSPGRVGPAEKGATSLPTWGDAGFKDWAPTGKRMETSGRGGSWQALWAHEKNCNTNNTFQSFISLRVTGEGFHWPEMREAWWFSTPPSCFSTTHREGVAASGKDGAAPDPSLLRLSSENHSRRSSPFLLRLAGGPDDCSLYNTNSYCRLWSILSGA